MANAWFVRQLLQDPTLESSYVKSTVAPSCFGTVHICAINTFDDGSNQPIIDEAILKEMVLALDAATSTPNVELKA
ncbi:hypothetical protein [Pedobacter gandavensis]|uniref:hypothetical protein n=1 Tax=Pedobacter gandavensis TaxID=2679963 RepID=UPI00292ECC73|nr:hypothetical protein [Pedobacter gandavensis]